MEITDPTTARLKAPKNSTRKTFHGGVAFAVMTEAGGENVVAVIKTAYAAPNIITIGLGC